MLLIVFRNRKKLTGVGSKKVMAENGLTLEALLAAKDSENTDKKQKKEEKEKELKRSIGFRLLK